MPYLVDSDVLIDLSRGNAEARQYIDALAEGWAISQVSALELIVGARDKRDLAEIETFLSAYVVVPLSSSIGERAYDLLRRYAKIIWSSCLRLTRCSHGNGRAPDSCHSEPSSLRND